MSDDNVKKAAIPRFDDTNAVTTNFVFENGDKVSAQFLDGEMYAWRLIVNGDPSDWSTYYPGILRHEGFGLATDYWNGVLPVEIPFRITEGSKIEGGK